MLKIFNFFKSDTGETELQSMRQRFDAMQTELNAVLESMSDMPEVTINASERKILIQAPEQFLDEALALPAPDDAEASAEDTDDASQDAPEETSAPKAS